MIKRRKVKMGKLLSKVFGIILIVIVVVVLFRNFIIKTVATVGFKSATTLPLKIGHFNLGIISSKLEIKDLRIENPKDYKNDRLLADMPEIYVDYRIKPLLTGKIHIDEIRYHLRELVIVVRADGTKNIDNLLIMKKAKKTEEKAKKAPKEDSSKTAKKKTNVQIDNLSFRVDTVKFIKYDEEGEAKTKEWNINLDANYEDIKSLEAVGGLILTKAIAKTTIASLTNLDLGGLNSIVSGSLGAGKEAATKIMGTATDTASETLKGTTSGIKNIFKKAVDTIK